MDFRRILTLARFTLLEAWRTRLPVLFMIALAIVFGAAYFFQQLAITDSQRVQIVISAAASRLVAVFVLSLYILTCIVREFNDKGLELTLSFDLRRSNYVAGRMLGFLVIALFMALLAGAMQLLLAPTEAVLQWGTALALELTIIAALSLFCVMTFTHLMPAASFIAAFYLLARALTAIQLMSNSPLAIENPLSHQVMSWLVDGLALVLPALDRFTQSAWLTDGMAGWPAIAACALQAALYVPLLVAAAMFDFYRRNL
jgi:hypothetical protein